MAASTSEACPAAASALKRILLSVGMRRGSFFREGGDTPPKEIPTLGAAGGRPRVSEMTEKEQRAEQSRACGRAVASKLRFSAGAAERLSLCPLGAYGLRLVTCWFADFADGRVACTPRGRERQSARQA